MFLPKGVLNPFPSDSAERMWTAGAVTGAKRTLMTSKPGVEVSDVGEGWVLCVAVDESFM